MAFWRIVDNKRTNKPTYMCFMDADSATGKWGRGYFVKHDKVPEVVKAALIKGSGVVDDSTLDLFGVIRDCLFCNKEDCKLSRNVNGQIVYLCNEHYYDKNVGQIAQKIKENQDVDQGQSDGQGQTT